MTSMEAIMSSMTMTSAPASTSAWARAVPAFSARSSNGMSASGFLKLVFKASVIPMRLATMQKGPTTFPMTTTSSPYPSLSSLTASMSSGTRPSVRKSSGKRGASPTW